MKKKYSFLLLFALTIVLTTAKAQESASANVKFSDVKDAYVEIVHRYDNFDNEEETGTDYFLFDISGNGIPELWIITGTAEYCRTLKVYTYIDGTDRMIYETGAGHTEFYAGDNYILCVYSRSDGERRTRLYYNGNSIDEKVVLEMSPWDDWDNYKGPEEEEISLIEISDVSEINNVFDRLEKELMKAKERAALKSRKNYPDSCFVQVVPPDKKRFKWLYGLWYNPRSDRYIVLTPKHIRDGKKLGDIFHQKFLKLTVIKKHPTHSEYIILNDGDSLNLYADEVKQTLFSESNEEDAQEVQIYTWEKQNTLTNVIFKLVMIIVCLVLGIVAVVFGVVFLIKGIKKLFRVTKEKMPQVKESINKTSQQIKQKSAESYALAKEKTKQAVELGKEKTKQAVELGKEKADSLKDKLSELADNDDKEVVTINKGFLKKALIVIALISVIALIVTKCSHRSSNSKGNSGNRTEKIMNKNSQTNKNRYENVPWQQCVDIDFRDVSVGMMRGPGLEVTNICDETIREVRVTLYAGAASEGYSFYNLKPGESDTKPIRMPHFDDFRVSVRF